MAWFVALLAGVALERLAELLVARANAAYSRALGAVEVGARHYPLLVVLHTGLLVGAGAEAIAAPRPFVPALGWTCLAVVLAAQALRWWCIATLGRRWNTRVLVVPGLPLIHRGPYRWLRHPNYLAVVVEGVALPLVHTAWITAAAFTVLNALVLAVRIRAEDTALGRRTEQPRRRSEPSGRP